MPWLYNTKKIINDNQLAICPYLCSMPRQPHSMAQISSPTSSKDSEQADIQNSHHCQMIFHVISTLYAAIQYYTTTFYDKVEYHTLALTGHAWVLELLTGHPERICCELGVHHHVFYALLHHLQTPFVMLESTSNMLTEQSLSAFFYFTFISNSNF